jgi:hypothetical protein
MLSAITVRRVGIAEHSFGRMTLLRPAPAEVPQSADLEHGESWSFSRVAAG